MVKRYIATDEAAWMVGEDGNFVHSDDYDALAARLAEAERLLWDVIENHSNDGNLNRLLRKFLVQLPDNGDAPHISHICGTPDAMCDTECMARAADNGSER